MVALGVEWEWAPGILHRDENSLKLIDAAAASLGKVTKSDLNCTSEVAGFLFFFYCGKCTEPELCHSDNFGMYTSLALSTCASLYNHH